MITGNLSVITGYLRVISMGWETFYKDWSLSPNDLFWYWIPMDSHRYTQDGDGYPLIMLQFANWKMAIEIVSFPSQKMAGFSSSLCESWPGRVGLVGTWSPRVNSSHFIHGDLPFNDDPMGPIEEVPDLEVVHGKIPIFANQNWGILSF